jgi:hypothetical protein
MIQTKGGSTYFRSVDKQNYLVVDVGLDDRSMLYIYMLIITILMIFINNLTKLFDFQGGYLVIPKQHTLIELHEQVHPYVIEVGFHEIIQLCLINLDNTLIVVLIEIIH